MKPIIYSELKELFSKSTDIALRPFVINADSDFTAYLFCVDGLVNSMLFDESVLKPISVNEKLKECKTEEDILNLLKDGACYHAFAGITDDAEMLMQVVLSGMGAIFFDGGKAAFFDVRGFDKRSISEPQEESSVKGAKDCFVETLRTNTSLIRRRIRSPHLVIAQDILGKVSKIDYAIVYIDGIADEQVIARLKNKIKSIDIDNVPTSSFVEEFVVEHKLSIFPQTFCSQRPDSISSNLTDGRVALIIDGLPFVYMFPCQFNALMQTPEDFSQNYFISSSLRFLRYLCISLSLTLPAFYIAVTSFHTEILPMQLAMSIQNAKTEVPFTSFIEVLGLLLGFEILMEAGIRLSKNLGQAISVVGALVVGQAAVDAKIVSPVVLIVVAVTAITAFTIPYNDLVNTVRIIRWGIAFCAAIWGLCGMTVGVLIVLIHLCSLDNYGVSYLAPMVDAHRNRFQDTIFRFPVSNFKFRPFKVSPRNIRKQG